MATRTPEQQAAHAAYNREWIRRNPEKHRAKQLRSVEKRRACLCTACGERRDLAARSMCWPCYRLFRLRRYVAGDAPPVQLDDHVAKRLWAKIERREPGACWPWHGNMAGRGKCPALRLGGSCHGRKESAVRLLYAIHCGITPPPGSHVVRRCGGLRCMNPTHFVMLRASGAGIPPAVRERLGMLPLTVAKHV